MKNVNYQFMLYMLIVLLGYVCKKTGILKEKDGESLSRIVFNITLPALIINTFSSIKVDTKLLLLPAVSIVFGLVMCLIAIFTFRKEDCNTKGMLSMALPGFNIGLFAYPLIEALFGENGLKYIAMFDMGNAIIVFGVCYLLASYYSSDEGILDFKSIVSKLLKSIPLLAYIITLTINLCGLHFPVIIIDISKTISKANMPLSLLLLGLYLNFSLESSHLKNMSKVLSLRYILGLVVGIILYFVLPFDQIFRITLLIGLILPIGLAVIPYSVQFNYNQKFVGSLTNATIVISFLLIWLIASTIV